MVDPFGLFFVLLASGPLVSDVIPSDGVSAIASTQHDTPDADLERRARTYRIRVYQTFHRQRPEHDRRRAALYRVLDDWTAAGTPAEARDRLNAWLAAATAAATPGSLAPLPAFPKFDVSRSEIPKPEIPKPKVPKPEIPKPESSPTPKAPLALPETHVASLRHPSSGSSPAPGPNTDDAIAMAPDPAMAPSSTSGSHPSDANLSEISVDVARDPEVRVNLTELDAQITGYNMALKALDMELDREEPIQDAQAVKWVEQLKRLALRRDDCRLVTDVLAEQDRRLVSEIEPFDPVIARLERRVTQAAQRIASLDASNMNAKQIAKRELLERLGHMLAELRVSENHPSK